MPDDTMPRPETGIYRRSDSTQLQWRIKVPQELRSLYPSQWAHGCSLGTADLREANRKAAQLRAQWLTRFDEQRQQLNPQKVERITPAMAKFLAEKAVHDSLAQDEKLRTDPSEQEWLLRWMQGMGMQGADVAPTALGGMPDALAEMLEDLHEQHDEDAGKALARGKIIKALPGMQYVAQQAGILFDADTPGAIEGLQTYLKAIRQATALKVRRDQGEVVNTPPAPSLKAIEDEQPRFLRDVFVRWQAAKKRGKDAVQACERALKLYEQHTGNPPIRTLKRAQGDAFRAWLLAQKGASKTKHDRLTWVKSLLGYAARDLEWLTKNPWEGLDIEHGTENRRSTWTTEQVQAFFGLPLFQRYELPTLKHAAGAAAYWVPLLGLYTGARVGELCQLRVADIVSRDGQTFISINDDGEGATVKTAAGVRDIPIHSELIRLGFLEYANATGKAGNELLWPAIKVRDGKPGFFFSRWFNQVARKLVKDCEIPDFHSFRHTVRTKMTEAGIADAVQDRITGHEVKGSTGTRVYAHPTAILRKAVEAITYPGLKLPKAYKSSEHN
jgi:integrase